MNGKNIQYMIRELIFRGRSKETGEWIEGKYFPNVRKVTTHSIYEMYTNNLHEIYGESLQLKDFDGKFKDI